MIVRRTIAVVVAVGLVAGAWLVRSNVLDDDSSGGGGTAPVGTVVCVPDLAAACREAVGGAGEVELVVEDVDVTLARLAEVEAAAAPVWVTLDPLPAVAADLRAAGRQPELLVETTTVASSPMSFVVDATRIETLTAECGDPVDWPCLGALAGRPWTDVDPDAAPGSVRPGFAAHPDTALGQLGVADAVTSYFAGAPISASDPGFITWARPLADAVDPSQLQRRSAVATIQVRPSLLDVAVGAESELEGEVADLLAVAYPRSMMRADVVIAVPGGAELPGNLIDGLRAELTTSGWGDPAGGPSNVPSSAQMIAAQQAWAALT